MGHGLKVPGARHQGGDRARLCLLGPRRWACPEEPILVCPSSFPASPEWMRTARCCDNSSLHQGVPPETRMKVPGTPPPRGACGEGQTPHPPGEQSADCGRPPGLGSLTGRRCHPRWPAGCSLEGTGKALYSRGPPSHDQGPPSPRTFPGGARGGSHSHGATVRGLACWARLRSRPPRELSVTWTRTGSLARAARLLLSTSP